MRVRSFEELYCFLKNFSDAVAIKENRAGEMDTLYITTVRGEKLRMFYFRYSHGGGDFKIETIEPEFCTHFDEIVVKGGVNELVFFSLYRRGQYVGLITVERKQFKRG